MTKAAATIATGREARGTPWAQWWYRNGHRMATEAETRAEYGCSPEAWLAAWRELSGKRANEWVPWL